MERETTKKEFDVSSGQRKGDTWWRNKEVQESIQSKRSTKKKWDGQGDEGNRHEYWECRCTAKRDVAKEKGLTLRKDKGSCINWLGRKIDLERMCNRSG